MHETFLENILIVSVTINLSVGIFFFLGSALLRLLLGCSEGLADRIFMFNTQRPGLFNKIFRDTIFHLVLFGLGVYILLFTDILQIPFIGLSYLLRVSLGIAVGNYIYKAAQDFLLRERLTTIHADLLHHFVAVFTYSVILLRQQNAVMGAIGLIFEGNLAFFGVGKLLKHLQYEKFLKYVIVLFFGILVSFITRGASPVVILIHALRSSNPFLMDYLPLSCFFLNIIFFTMVNLWIMKTSLMSFLRSVKHHRLYMQSNGDEIVENLRLDIYTNRCVYTNDFAQTVDDVMNNARTNTSCQTHFPIPVSNLNVNTSQTQSAEELQSLDDLDLELDDFPSRASVY